MSKDLFREFFRRATGLLAPFPFQIAFALGAWLPTMLSAPTGLGKTATIILGWLFRRHFHSDLKIRKSTPRRLVYCLPMRTLVEQTAEQARTWLKNLGLADKVDVHVLMGGQDAAAWDAEPEREAILIGTQEMLLSRALNRGYGMSRYRWPMAFGLLSNDCLWVMDETQLMGVGVATTAQLQGLRQKLETYGPTHSIWMSATLDTQEIATIDHSPPAAGFRSLGLTDEDRGIDVVKQRVEARKPLVDSGLRLTRENEKQYPKQLAERVLQEHRAGTLTLVIVNSVARAQDAYRELAKRIDKASLPPQLGLIHSRFRRHDRSVHEALLFAKEFGESGAIIFATQAIEAGVDVSATTMFTELSAWPSCVQRWGRCNRQGKCDLEGKPGAKVLWMDLDTSVDKFVWPYTSEELDRSRDYLRVLQDVGPQSLAKIAYQSSAPVRPLLRRKDILELWDTTPDLAGNDLDVSRYIRDSDDCDVQFYWRDWEGKPPSPDQPAPGRDELCSVSLAAARDFVSKKIEKDNAWIWNPLLGKFESMSSHSWRPGLTILLKRSAGGYSNALGWTGDPKQRPAECPRPDTEPNEGMGQDEVQPNLELTQHLQEVANHANKLQRSFPEFDDTIPWQAVETAALWHDVGKAHEAFQTAARDGLNGVEDTQKQWAKMSQRGMPRYRIRVAIDPDRAVHRIGFRHELASALAFLKNSGETADADLIAFLIAAHHGKVRGSIRSLPHETQPANPGIRFARGVWDGDLIPSVDLGNGSLSAAFEVQLPLMLLGDSPNGKSWLARVLSLRNEYGPFRLAFLETLVRVADWRGSATGETHS